MRQVRRKAALSYHDGHCLHLLHGHDYFGDGFGRRDPNLAEMETAWQALRDELLPQWIDEHPGTRPYAWWRFDAPEPRRRLDGEISCDDDYGNWTPRTWPDFETEREYLERHNLLTDSERADLLLADARTANNQE